MSAPGVPQPRRSAEDIAAEIDQVVTDRMMLASGAGAEAMADLLEREVRLWRELHYEALGTPFSRAVSGMGAKAEAQAEWWRGRAAERAAAAVEVLDGVR